MVTDTRPLRRRIATPIAFLVVVAMILAACGSAATGLKTRAPASPQATATVVAVTSPNPAANFPDLLPGATSTPATSMMMAGSAAVALQDQMVAVIKQVTPAIVVIETDQGLGSGIIYNTKGDIITNAHVVVTATTFKVTLSNGHVYAGTLVGSYAPDDIAVIHINATGLTPASFGDSSQLAVGDFVLAMGNPLGLQSSVTEGIVSALGRQVSEPAGNALPDVIQTSAAINPGNSGGALVDLNGQVVGIPTLEASDPQIGGAAGGIGFAISSNRAKTIADQLIASGKVTNSGRAYMGVELRDGTNGPFILTVTAGGPAAKAGLVVGDMVLSVNGTLTPDGQTLIDLIAKYHPGDTIKIKVQHQDGTAATYSLTLAQLPG
jgi:S1-C subfamily serine protease